MTGKVVIIGAGEHARICIEHILIEKKYEILGLVTDDKNKIKKNILGYEILVNQNEINLIKKKFKKLKYFFIGFGPVNCSMQKRLKSINFFKNYLDTINIIHPISEISKSAKLGSGNLIESFTKIGSNVKLGNHCYISSFSCICHDQTIGDNVLISGHSSLTGKFVGSGSIISDGVVIGFKKKIGKNCFIAEKTLVNRDVPNNSWVFGCPTKIKKINSQFVNL